MTTVIRSVGAISGAIDTTLQQIRDEVAGSRTLSHLAAQSPDGLMRLTLDGHLAEVNPAVERLLGWRPDVLCGRALTALAHPDDRPGVEARIARLLATPASDDTGSACERITFRARRVDARYSWFELALCARHDDAGHRTGMVGALRSVDARHAASGVERQRTSEHAALMRIGRAIAAGATGSELDTAAAAELVEVLQPRAIVVHSTDADADVAACDTAMWRDAPVDSPAPGLDEPLDADGPVAQAVALGAPVTVEYADCSSDHGRGLALMWRFGVSAPILSGGRVCGAITAVYGPADGPPDEAVGRVLELAAELIGLVRERD